MRGVLNRPRRHQGGGAADRGMPYRSTPWYDWPAPAPSTHTSTTFYRRRSELLHLSWSEVCARRLERHALSTPSQDARPAEIVAAICGAHAQVLPAAELSVGLRIAGITRTHVQEALWNEHSLVKTFGPRGTVHLLPARDLPMWAGALSALPPAPSPFPQDVRMTPEQTDE